MKVLLKRNDGAHGKVIVRSKRTTPEYGQLSAYVVDHKETVNRECEEGHVYYESNPLGSRHFNVAFDYAKTLMQATDSEIESIIIKK